MTASCQLKKSVDRILSAHPTTVAKNVDIPGIERSQQLAFIVPVHADHISYTVFPYDRARVPHPIKLSPPRSRARRAHVDTTFFSTMFQSVMALPFERTAMP
jgi:hypothetical protein